MNVKSLHICASDPLMCSAKSADILYINFASSSFGVLHAAPCQKAAEGIKVHYYILLSRFIVTSLIMIRDDLSFMYYVCVV